MEDVINIVNNYFPYEKTEKGYIFTDDNFDYASLMCCYVTEPYSKEKYEKYEYYKADLEVSREKEEELKKLSNKELEILRNYPYALAGRSEEHTSELQSPDNLVCRLLLEKKKASEKQKNC